MSLFTAIKAFFKAWREPEAAQQFLNEQSLPLIPAEPTGTEAAHLRLLALLQRSGRLVDFLKEDLAGFSDAEVGAASRQVHKECAALLEDLVTIRPVYQEEEGSRVRIPAGYDPSTVKVIGNVKGTAPFEGTLVHRGWKAHKRSLPKHVKEVTHDVIHPAEVEIK